MNDKEFEKSFITTYRSKNFNDRPKTISHIVLHYTDTLSIEESLSILCDPEKKVSAHFLIGENGDIYQLVDIQKRAWHAGISTWDGIDNVNDYSIGIELQNKGHTHPPLQAYPPIQMQQLLTLIQYLTKLLNIDPKNIIGHSDIAPNRKKDPGEHFDWQFLKKNGFGIERFK